MSRTCNIQGSPVVLLWQILLSVYLYIGQPVLVLVLAILSSIQIVSNGKEQKTFLICALYVVLIALVALVEVLESRIGLSLSRLCLSALFVVLLYRGLAEVVGFTRVSTSNLIGISLIMASIVNGGLWQDFQAAIIYFELLVFAVVCAVYGISVRWRERCLLYGWLGICLMWMCWVNLDIHELNQSIYKWQRVLALLGHVLFGVAMLRWLSIEAHALRYLIYTFVVLMLLFISLFLYYWLFSSAEHSWKYSFPFFLNIRHFCFLLIPAFWLLLWGYYAAGRDKLGGVCIASLVVVTFFVVWSGARGAILAIVLVLPVLFYVLRREELLRIRIALLAALLIAVFLDLFFQVDDVSFNVKSMFARLFPLAEGEGNKVMSGRWQIWTSWWSEASDRPLTGFGGEAFRYLKERISPMAPLSHPHNSIVQVYIEWGAIGCLLAAIGLMLLAGKILASLKSREAPYFILGLCLTLSLGLYSLVDGVFYYNYPGMLLSLSIALMFVEPIPSAELDELQLGRS